MLHNHFLSKGHTAKLLFVCRSHNVDFIKNKQIFIITRNRETGEKVILHIYMHAWSTRGEQSLAAKRKWEGVVQQPVVTLAVGEGVSCIYLCTVIQFTVTVSVFQAVCATKLL